MAKIPKISLSIRGLTVRRNTNFALRVDNLQLHTGQVVCVAGANGSGKTTLIETIVGLLVPDDGKILVCNQVYAPDNLAAKKLLGFIPDDDSWIIPELTAREYFALLASIYVKAGVEHDLRGEAKMLASRLLFDSFDQQLGSLSHGNKKKVQIVAALMHRPVVLVVDELRNGLDPIAIIQAEGLLKELSLQGTGVFAATHDLWWAQRFADEIIMLHRGEVILQAETANVVTESGSLEAKFMQLYSKSND